MTQARHRLNERWIGKKRQPVDLLGGANEDRTHDLRIANATHLSQQMRDKTLNLLYAYHAEVELVYLEQARSELLRRNSRRDTTLTNKALEGMLRKWEIPFPTEAHAVIYA